MQSSMQTFKPAAISRSVTARAGRRAAAPVVRCQGLPSAIKEAGKVAAAAALAVSLVLGAPMPAHANKKPPTRLELKQAYEAELRASLKARGAATPAEINSSPKGLAIKEAVVPELKLENYGQTKVVTPARVPTPDPVRAQ